MDDFAAKLQGILSSPEGQEQLRGIAGMLGMDTAPTASAPPSVGQSFGNGGGGMDLSGLLNALGGVNGLGGSANAAAPAPPPPPPAGQPGGGLDLSALMSMLGGANGGSATATQPMGNGAGGAGGMDLSGLMSMLGGANGLAGGAQQSGGTLPGMPNIDMNMILKVQKIFGSMNVNDKNSQLLLALKPHFGERRQAKVDQAIGLMRIFSALPALRESGILSGLTGLTGLTGL